MVPPVSAALTSSQELLALTHKVNFFQEDSKSYPDIIFAFPFLLPKCVSSWLCSSLFSSESLWWKSYAESGSTAASSSSSLSWVQASTSSPTPGWRKPTSWRWQSASWDGCRSSAGLWTLQLWMVSPMSRRGNTSSPVRTRREDWIQRQSCLLWAPQPRPPASRGGHGRRLGGEDVCWLCRCLATSALATLDLQKKKKKKSGYSWIAKLCSKNTLTLVSWLVWQDHHIYLNSVWFPLH